MKLNLTRVGAAVVTAGLVASLGALAPVPAFADESMTGDASAAQAQAVDGGAADAAVAVAGNADAAKSGSVAKIGDVTYASLDDALAAARSGDTIELQQDGVIAATNTISKAVTIKGNGKFSVKVTAQSGTDDGRLNISGAGSLTFDNAKVSFGNPSNWSVVMSDSGKLSFVNGSAATFTQHGIYTGAPGSRSTSTSRASRFPALLTPR